MIKKLNYRIEESYNQLATLVRSENFHLLLLTNYYELTLGKEEKNVPIKDYMKEYEKIAESISEELLASVNGSKFEAVLKYQLSHYFIHIVTIIETTLFDLQKIILMEFPEKISNLSFDFKELLSIDNTTQIISRGAEKYLNQISYKRPQEYRRYFLEIISASDEFLKNEWVYFVEMKARRDLGVHNNWLKNDTYENKVSEVGYTDIDKSKYLYPSSDYFDDSIDIIHKMIRLISAHLNKKFA